MAPVIVHQVVIPTLVGSSAEREVGIRHGLDVPDTIALLLKGIRPITAQSLGNGVTQSRAPETHADEVSLLVSGLAIYEAVTAMQDREVVDEVKVTGNGGELELGSTRDGLNGVEGLELLGIDGWQVGLARMSGGAQERDAAEVHDKLAILVEEDRAAVVAGAVGAYRQHGSRWHLRWDWKDLQCEWPVLTGQDPKQVRSSGSQNVVDGGSRCNDTLPSHGSRASSKPGDDVSRLLVVESLVHLVSRSC